MDEREKQRLVAKGVPYIRGTSRLRYLLQELFTLAESDDPNLQDVITGLGVLTSDEEDAAQLEREIASAVAVSVMIAAIYSGKWPSEIVKQIGNKGWPEELVHPEHRQRDQPQEPIGGARALANKLRQIADETDDDKVYQQLTALAGELLDAQGS